MKNQFIVTHFFGTVEAESWNSSAPEDWIQERANNLGREVDLYESDDALGNIVLANGLPVGRKVGESRLVKSFKPQS